MSWNFWKGMLNHFMSRLMDQNLIIIFMSKVEQYKDGADIGTSFELHSFESIGISKWMAT